MASEPLSGKWKSGKRAELLSNIRYDSVDVLFSQVIPEPSSALLIALGVLGFAPSADSKVDWLTRQPRSFLAFFGEGRTRALENS